MARRFRVGSGRGAFNRGSLISTSGGTGSGRGCGSNLFNTCGQAVPNGGVPQASGNFSSTGGGITASGRRFSRRRGATVVLVLAAEPSTD